MGKTKRLSRKNKKALVKLSEVLDKCYSKNIIENSQGQKEECYTIPLEEAEQLIFDSRKMGLIKRISSSVRNLFRGSTSDADDEGTTDIGSIGPSAMVGDNSFYTEVMRMSKEDQTRFGKYKDYDKMDEECVEVQRALDVTVANAFTSRDGDQESYILKSDNTRVLSIIEDTDGRVDMPNELPGICRSYLQRGDDFEEVVVDENRSIVRLKYLNQEYMHRNEDVYGRLDSESAYTMKIEDGHEEIHFKPWQVIHLRYQHKRGSLYGRAFYFPARKTWRRSEAMEDSVVMERIHRGNDRIIYYISSPVRASAEQKNKLLEDAKASLKRKRVVDQQTGKVNWRKAPMASDEDIFMLTNSESPSKAEKLGASNIIGQLSDLEYFQNKLTMATGVPKSYLGLERDVNAKATLQWEDIQYARQLRKIQKDMAWFQRRVYDLQLMLLGIVPEEGLYEIVYPPISFIDEELKINILKLKWEIAVLAKGLNIPMRWVLSNILGLSEEDVEDIIVNMEPEQQPMPGQFMLPGGVSAFQPQPSESDLATVRDKVFSTSKLSNEVRELRDMLYMIAKNDLRKSVSL